MKPLFHSGFMYVPDPSRTTGTLPVAEHLRPVRDTLVPEAALYERLAVLAEGPHWRRYSVVDFVPAELGFALPIAGEA